MKNIPIVDAHHHLWDLNNEHTKYSWLMVTEGEAFFGSATTKQTKKGLGFLGYCW